MSTFWLFCLLVLAGRMLIEWLALAPLEDEAEEESGTFDGLISPVLAVYAITGLTDDDD